MEKFSVKKPYTILVMVVMILALGFVSVTRMTTELLPDFEIPYMLVITTYAGASPETVEAGVTEPLESELGTISGVENVYSYSMENYSLIQLEFEEDTDMDSALVNISTVINEIESSLPDEAGTPLIMELSMDMVATMYVGVSYEGYDEYELTDYVSSEVIPYLERQEGVASVSSVGLVEETVVVELDQDKIDDLNDEILSTVNEQLAEAKEALDEAQAQVDEAIEALEESQAAFGDTLSSTIFESLTPSVESASSSLASEIASLQAQIEALKSAIESLEESDTTSAADSIARAAVTSAVQAASDSLSASVSQIVSSNASAISGVTSSAAKAAGSAASAALVSSLSAALSNETTMTQLVSYLVAGNTSSLESAVSEIFSDAADDAVDAAISALSASLSSAEVTSLTQTLTSALTDAVSEAAADAVSAMISSVSTSTSAGTSSVTSSLISQLDALSEQLSSASSSMGDLSSTVDALEEVYASLTQAQLEAAVAYATAAVELTQLQATLEEAQETYDEQREIALESANLDDLLTLETLAALVYAQNFSMPAGYIDDEDDNSWLLKIGDEFEDADDIADVLLVDLDTIGTIRLSDVATITVIDNADESYATLNGDDGIVLMIYKSSAYGTNAVSTVCNEALEELAAEDANFEYMVLMDQGSYIDLIVQSVLLSILLGGILAIIVLALFLKDVKPTIVVAISIPLSVLLALVLMYFTGLGLNMMTLSGLALGIGMLVDNSIVVLENILRLRNSGMSAAHAAVQGAKQVRSAIIASTLTTICVFLPVVFTNGTVRTLLVPLALSIGYCLAASLLIALTVVPAATSTIFRNIKPKQFKILSRIQDKYETSLRWCLSHKAIPLGGAIALLAITIYAITQMGIIFFPEITTTAVQVTIETPEDDTLEESYAKVDAISEAILTVDGVEDIGIMSSGSTVSMLGVSLTSSDTSYGSYVCYVTIPDDTSAKEAAAICEAIEAVTSDIDAEVVAASDSMSDMTSLMSSSGLTVNIYGEDLETLQEISADLQEIVAQVEGFGEATDGTEEGEETLHLVIDKDKAMSYGLTVAQIYTEVATALTTSAVSTTVWIDSVEIDVEIVDETDVLTVETLLDLEFEIESTTSTTDSSIDLSALTGEDDDTDDDEADEEEDDGIVTLGEFASLEYTTSMSQIDRENQTRYISLTAEVEDGYNTTLLTRELKPLLAEYEDTLPYGYSIEISGESSQISEMLSQIIQMALLGFLFIYLIMVAEFQSLKSPFIVIFTIPLAFTGGMLGLLITGEQLSILSLIGFIVLMGTVVNNGIVFVDYTNQLRLGGLERHDALCAAGRTRMRPIIMTALTTILALSRMIFGSDMGSQLGRGMSIVIAGGLLYATLMTLYIIPIIYDIFFKRQPLNIDTGDDLEDVPDDAGEYLRLHGAQGGAEPDSMS